MSPHTNPCLCITLALVVLLSQPTRASRAYVPPEHQVSVAHVVVTGTIAHVSWNKTKVVEVMGKRTKRTYRLATLAVDEVLKNDLAGLSIQAGGTLEFPIAPKRWRKPKNFLGAGPGYKKGMVGIWLLRYSGDGLVPSGIGEHMPYAELEKVRRILPELGESYREAIQSRIPMEARRRKEVLSLPAYPQNKIDSLLHDGKGLLPGVDPSTVYVLNLPQKPMEALFLDGQGRVVGGIPYFPDASSFSEGRLPVYTRLEKDVYKDYRFIGRDGNLLPKPPYEQQTSFSEELSIVSRAGLHEFVDATGKEVIPCIYERVMAFSGGMAPVTRGGKAFLLDRQGTMVFEGNENVFSPTVTGEGLALVSVAGGSVGYVDIHGELVIDMTGTGCVPQGAFRGGFAKVRAMGRPPERTSFIDREGRLIFPPMVAIFGNYSAGLVAFCAHEKTDKWGYMDAKGKVVIPPQFIRAGEFGDGRALVEYSGWRERRPVNSADGKVRLAPGAHRHFLCTHKGFIDRKGNLVNPFGFDWADGFRNGLARVQYSTWTKARKAFGGLMDRDGEIVFVISNSFAVSEGGKGN